MLNTPLAIVIGGGLGLLLAIFCQKPADALLDWLTGAGETFWAWVGRGFKRDKSGPTDPGF